MTKAGIIFCIFYSMMIIANIVMVIIGFYTGNPISTITSSFVSIFMSLTAFRMWKIFQKSEYTQTGL